MLSRLADVPLSSAPRPAFGAAPTARREGRHVAEVQRRRLLAATVELVAEQGAHAVTIVGLCQRAGLSRKTFYELFGDVEQCLLAAFQQTADHAAEVVQGGIDDASPWAAQIRGGLVSLLRFLDEQPNSARLLFVDALAAGPQVAAARTRVLATAMAAVHRDAPRGRTGKLPALAAEGVVGAVCSVIHARLVASPSAGPEERLTDLTGPLMALIVGPYLGPAAARRELAAPLPSSTSRSRPVGEPLRSSGPDPLAGLQLRMTYRTARVLESIAAAPGASSKRVAIASGIADEGQMSRLLARLERCELVCDTGGDPAQGQARAWRLTAQGEDVLRAVAAG